MRRASLLSLSLLATLSFAATLAAQSGTPEPKRPELPAGADTNDAAVYMRYGIARLDDNPKDAAEAFYWASRIDPQMGEAFYARRIALLLSDRPRLVSYIDRSKKTMRSPEIRSIDSLQLRALVLNPFLYRRFDRKLLTEYVFEMGRREGYNAAEMNAFIMDAFRHMGPWMSGWLAYCDARFPAALDFYEKAMKHDKDEAYGAHAERARIFYLLGNYDSALTEMTAAVDGMRKQDDKDLVFEYDSKAVYEQGIGMIQEHLGHLDAARDAYARALQEDLSYYPAHVRLSQVALQKGDTAAAVNEMDLAVQLRGDQPGLRYDYGMLLLYAAKDSLAEQQMRKAIELEPYYAAPYQYLARILDAHGQPAPAIAQYEAFLARASSRDPMVAWTRNRIAYLKGGTQGATEHAP